MRPITVLAGFVAAALVGFLSPAAATAAPSPDGDVPVTAAANFSRYCGTGRVESIANNLPVYSEPNRTSTVHRVYQKGDQVNCIMNSYVYVTNPNGRYTACGVENANGWIRVKLNQNDDDYVTAYVYMTCVKDV